MSYQDFLEGMNLPDSDFTRMVFDLFDTNEHGIINFREVGGNEHAMINFREVGGAASFSCLGALQLGLCSPFGRYEHAHSVAGKL